MNTAKNVELNEQSLETKIGLYWLHKLGIVSIVLGMVFLIMYSFQFFAPGLKLLTGLVVSSSLILLGSKMAAKEQQKWFGHGLTAGGWSLLYFTTYAAHYLPNVSIISSLPLETILLMAVAAGSLLSALSASSEIMSIYSVSLAAGSILLSGPNLVGDISFLIIAIASAVLGNRRNWNILFGFGMCASYAGHVFCSFNALSIPEQTLASAFLAGIWFVFTLGLGYYVPKSPAARTFVTVLTCANAGALFLGIFSLDRLQILDVSQGLLAAAGGVYLATSRWLSKRGEGQMETLHSVLGLSLLNVAKVLHFSGSTLIALDVMQIAVLGTIAAKYNLKVFRWFTYLLTFTLFPLWILGVMTDVSYATFGILHIHYVQIGLWAVGVLYALSRLSMNKRQAVPGLDSPVLLDCNFYHIAASCMSFLLIQQIHPGWQIFALTLVAAANGVLALKLKRDIYGATNVLFLYAVISSLAINWTLWYSLPLFASVAILYAFHAYDRAFPPAGKSELCQYLAPLHAVLATLLLTRLVFLMLPHDYTSAGWGLEGIGLLLYGFLLRDRLFRISGLLVLGLMTGKLVLIDFSNFDTPGRILSFVAAGVVFLLSSYGYARFTRAFEEKVEKRAGTESESQGSGSSEETDNSDAAASRSSLSQSTP